MISKFGLSVFLHVMNRFPIVGRMLLQLKLTDVFLTVKHLVVPLLNCKVLIWKILSLAFYFSFTFFRGGVRETAEQTIVSSQSRSKGKSILFVYIYKKILQVFCGVPLLSWRILIHQLSILCENTCEDLLKHGPNINFWKSHFIHAEQ